ncbi:hypothetical protein R3P38DRAFT_3368833 [Favolaschia claudopus]|uniref:Uncharacterized protein n=1 Tax=Favolaschia claudopus TaxID=2862362 RepID=A0AAW0A4G6_9AGAR
MSRPMFTRLLSLASRIMNSAPTFDALLDRGSTRGGRLLTYSRHQRTRRTKEDAHRDSRSQTHVVKAFFSCVAGKNTPRDSAKPDAVPPLTSICLFLLAQALRAEDEWYDDEIYHLFDIVPTHHHRLGLCLYGSAVIFSKIITNTDCHRAALHAMSLLSIDRASYSLAFLFIFPDSPYLGSAYSFSQVLLEALDGHHGQHCIALLAGSSVAWTVRESETMRSILFDLIVTAEIQRRREQVSVSRDRQLRPLLKCLIRDASVEKSEDSDDDLDCLR